MKNTINFLTIAILISIGIVAVNAQESNIVSVNETPTATEKVEKKNESVKKRQSADDSWTGFYVGSFGGYTNGRASANTSHVSNALSIFAPPAAGLITSVGTQRIKSNGINGGGAVGYNFQKRNFVIGAELDFGANRINKTISGSATFPNSNPGFTNGFTVTQSVKSNWMMTARHRIGVATKKALVYATGGLAITDLKYSGNFSEIVFSGKESGNFSKTKLGWVAGGGVEIKATKRLSVKGEYLFSQFGRNSITSNNLVITFLVAQPEPNTVFTHSTDLKSHSIRFGFNYRF